MSSAFSPALASVLALLHLGKKRGKRGGALGTVGVGGVCGCSDQIINASGSIKKKKAGTAEVQSPRNRREQFTAADNGWTKGSLQLCGSLGIINMESVQSFPAAEDEANIKQPDVYPRPLPF